MNDLAGYMLHEGCYVIYYMKDVLLYVTLGHSYMLHEDMA